MSTEEQRIHWLRRPLRYSLRSVLLLMLAAAVLLGGWRAYVSSLEQQQAAAQEEIEYFKRAFKACIEGRNYTIT